MNSYYVIEWNSHKQNRISLIIINMAIIVGKTVVIEMKIKFVLIPYKVFSHNVKIHYRNMIVLCCFITK